MKAYYDDEVDALYLRLGDEKLEGTIEIAEGVSLDTTSEDKIVGIEVLNASTRIDLRTLLSYTLEVEKDFVAREITQPMAPILSKDGLMLYSYGSCYIISFGGAMQQSCITVEVIC